MSITNKFKIIHKDTSTQIYNLVNSLIKNKLDNVSWLLVRLKAEQNIVYPSGIDLEARMYTI